MVIRHNADGTQLHVTTHEAARLGHALTQARPNGAYTTTADDGTPIAVYVHGTAAEPGAAHVAVEAR